jgi:hypothetical protein
VRFFGDLLQGAQQKIGDQRHGDLDAHRVFRSSDELRDPERLLHQPEEQLDPPSALVEVDDFLGRRVEVIGEKPQGLAGLGPEASRIKALSKHFPCRTAVGQSPDQVRGRPRRLEPTADRQNNG